jgi:hypothetical protein
MGDPKAKLRYGDLIRAGAAHRTGEKTGDPRLMDGTISESRTSEGRVQELHARLHGLLDALDHAQLHGPAAYVSMAIDTIQRDYPELNATR